MWKWISFLNVVHACPTLSLQKILSSQKLVYDKWELFQHALRHLCNCSRQTISKEKTKNIFLQRFIVTS
ncbi:hypothetical protein AAZX31_12G029800 [Glycine max]|nr:hypothetical protein GLYMA_12G030850v4 [Glycine max]KAH1141362.1 hypothetical protein GYH30_032549 [Glycine max]